MFWYDGSIPERDTVEDYSICSYLDFDKLDFMWP